MNPSRATRRHRQPPSLAINRSILEHEFESQRQRLLEEWSAFLAFPSISADPNHYRDCVACAEWLARHLEKIGLSVRLLPTSSKPLIFAERPGHPGHPVALVYGHYDVQPVDPLKLWQTPPFSPTFRNGRMYARGAQDNKGQLFALIKAVEILIRHQALAAPLKLLIEGDEESGNLKILDTLREHSHLLRCDVLMAADTGTVGPGVPTITLGLRGIVTLTVRLCGPNHDLHSGVHGGRVPNPATALAQLLATLHQPDGRVAVAGFYDGVRDPTPEEHALVMALPFDPTAYETLTGVPPVGGEQQYHPLERTGFRPALDVNGLQAGYAGAGSKTIIPANATAKLSARLVPGQDPERILAAVIEHLRQRTPRGLRFEVPEQGSGGQALRVELNSPFIQLARQVLDECSGGRTAFMWEGASVPVLSKLPELTGAVPVLVGFGSEEDHIHAPNESYSLEQLRNGYLFAAMFLSRL